MAMNVTWLKPGKKYEALVRFNKNHLALNNDACELLGIKYVDVGIDPDGVIILAEGTGYTVSTYDTAHGKIRGRIGGTGLAKQLAEAGFDYGTYKMVFNDKVKRWECYLVEKQAGRKVKKGDCKHG